MCFEVNTRPTSELIRCNNLLNEELRLRGKATGRNLETKRSYLMQIMKNECEMINSKKGLEHANPNVQSFYSLLTTIPCMLHG